MRIPVVQVDAFTDRPFAGNPAAVCLLERPLPEATMHAIAAEMNLSETAFVVPEGDAWRIRWFTPATEVDLCGHATLAAAHVLFHDRLAPDVPAVDFTSASGPLRVERDGDALALDFPSRPPHPVAVPEGLATALGRPVTEAWGARDLVVLLESEAAVRALAPDMALLRALPWFGVVVTAPGDHVDFVSRYFAPGEGVPEDPVTGSSHCTLVPFWAARLGKCVFEARQVSARGGELRCEDRGARVRISGRAVEVLRGTLEVPSPDVAPPPGPRANVEVKARVRDAAALAQTATKLAGTPPVLIAQEDTFFAAPRGRLKLRRLGPHRGELIAYERPDAPGPKRSDYRLVATDAPDALGDALGAALGTAGVVRKTRRLWLVGATRIHLDDVDGLGVFVELEVVLAPDESAADGERVARDLMQQLGVAEEDLVEGAYVDLLATGLGDGQRA